MSLFLERHAGFRKRATALQRCNLRSRRRKLRGLKDLHWLHSSTIQRPTVALSSSALSRDVSECRTVTVCAAPAPRRPLVCRCPTMLMRGLLSAVKQKLSSPAAADGPTGKPSTALPSAFPPSSLAVAAPSVPAASPTASALAATDPAADATGPASATTSASTTANTAATAGNGPGGTGPAGSAETVKPSVSQSPQQRSLHAARHSAHHTTHTHSEGCCLPQPAAASVDVMAVCLLFRVVVLQAVVG